MSIVEYPPGTSRRIQLTDGSGRCSMVWSLFSAKKSPDMYVTPKMFGGKIKISLHESGQFQVGLTKENSSELEESRHWERWQRGTDCLPGVIRAWYLIIPHEELRSAACDKKAYHLPPVGPDHAAQIEVLMVSNQGPTIHFDDAHVIGRWSLQGQEKSYLVVARRIPWPPERRTQASTARKQAVAQTEASGVVPSVDHRYYFHGHNDEGVRFGLELAAEDCLPTGEG